jgi:hypothetical protein
MGMPEPDDTEPLATLRIAGPKRGPILRCVARNRERDLALLYSKRSLDAPAATWLDTASLDRWFSAPEKWMAIGPPGEGPHQAHDLIGRNDDYFQVPSGIPHGFSGGAVALERSELLIGLIRLGGPRASASTIIQIAAIEAFLRGAKGQHAIALRRAPGPAPLQTTLDRALERWRSSLQSSSWSSLTPPFLFGRSLRLEDCYTELYFVPQSELGGVQSDADGDRHVIFSDKHPRMRTLRAISIESLLASNTRRTVIVGAPGSGKTTFLTWLTQQVTRGAASPFTLPIFVPLSAFARQIAVDPSTTILSFFFGMHGEGGVAAAHASAADLDRQTQCGRCFPLLLLDGWDEVPQPLRRGTLLAIESGTKQYFTIITSRPSGVPRVLQQDWSSLYEISALSSSAIRHMVLSICAATGAREQATRILELLDSDPALLDLCSNPFVLTLLCAVMSRRPVDTTDAHRVTRAWLMREALQLMNEERQAQGFAFLQREDYDALGRLALTLSFGNASKEIEFEPRLLDADGQDWETRFARAESARLLTAADPTGQSFRFVHLRIQEFLAAQELVGDPIATAQLPWQKIISPAWHEELKFLAALSADDPTHRLWESLRMVLAEHRDRASIAVVRVASMVAATRCSDGGVRFVGHDLRPDLWKILLVGGDESLLAMEALLELDADFLGRHLRELGQRLFDALPYVADAIPYRLIERCGLHGRMRRAAASSRFDGIHPIESTGSLVDERTRGALGAHKQSRSKRIEAILEVGISRDRSAVAALRTTMEDPDFDVFYAGCRALMTIRGPDAADALLSSIGYALHRRLHRRASIAADALRPAGHGALEPSSRDRLLRLLSTADRNARGTGYLLQALEGALIPFAGRAIVSALDSKNAEVSLAAVYAAGGLLEEDAIASALNWALSGKPYGDLVLSTLRYIPIDYSRLDELELKARDYVGGETAILLELYARTLRALPSHPVRAVFEELMADLVARWSSSLGELDRIACLESADVSLKRAAAAELARQSIESYVSGNDGDTLAFGAAIALFRLEGPHAARFVLEYLVARVPMWLSDLTTVQHLFRTLVKGLAAHAPWYLPQLLRAIESCRSTAHTAAVDELIASALSQAAWQGVLVYDDFTVDAYGRAVSSSGIAAGVCS